MLATKSNSYTFQKDGVWYFSRRVPADLRRHYRTGRIAYALRTESIRVRFMHCYPRGRGGTCRGPNRRPNRRPNYACCRNYNQTVALFCGVNALGRFLQEEPSLPRCATSSDIPKLTHCFPMIYLSGYLGRPPRGPPKCTLFETQREYILILT